MAKLTKVGARKHHTFYLEVTEDTNTIALDGSIATIKLNYKFWMYCSGGYYFKWGLPSHVFWGIKIDNKNVASGSFGTFMSGKELTIATGSYEVEQTTNGAVKHTYDFYIEDRINAKNSNGVYYTPGNCSWSNTPETFQTSNLTLWTNVDTPQANVVQKGNTGVYDNGDNTATILISDVNGGNIDGGTRNAFQYCGLNYKFLDHKPTADLPPDQCVSTGQRQDPRPCATVYIPPNMSYLHLQNVYAMGLYNRIVYGKSYGQFVKRYSKPNVPSEYQITSRLTDATNAVITISAKKGSSGENNESTGVIFEYQIVGGSSWVEVDPSDSHFAQDNDGMCTYEFDTDISNIGKIKARAATIGTEENKNRSVYIDDNLTKTEQIYQSNWVEFNDSNITISQPGIPTNLTIIDYGDNRFMITCQKGYDGEKNTAIGTQIYYTTDGTDPIINGQLSSTVKQFSGERINVLNDTIIKAVARTEGAHASQQFSDWSPMVSQSIKFYKAPNIGIPIISTVNKKKFTKKSIARIESLVNVYKHTSLKSCTYNLYKYGSAQPLNTKPLEVSASQFPEKSDENDSHAVLTYEVSLKDYNLKKDDLIYAKITCDVRDTANNNLVYDYPTSEMYLIESSGVMRINADGSWHEGQVWVNVKGNWKEATDVFMNVNDTWKESI